MCATVEASLSRTRVPACPASMSTNSFPSWAVSRTVRAPPAREAWFRASAYRARPGSVAARRLRAKRWCVRNRQARCPRLEAEALRRAYRQSSEKCVCREALARRGGATSRGRAPRRPGRVKAHLRNGDGAAAPQRARGARRGEPERECEACAAEGVVALRRSVRVPESVPWDVG